jgi:ribosomal protein S18 acetylase RimI-like enzyme
MESILIDSFPENAPAYNLYKNVGFTELEILKDFWKDETFYSI